MNAKKRTTVNKSATSGRYSKAVTRPRPQTTEKEIAEFVKGFYEKNGKAMTQLAYE